MYTTRSQRAIPSLPPRKDNYLNELDDSVGDGSFAQSLQIFNNIFGLETDRHSSVERIRR